MFAVNKNYFLKLLYKFHTSNLFNQEPEQLETKHNMSIAEEQADQQSEETRIKSVTTNYRIEGHVTSESSTKLTDDVHQSLSIKNLKKDDEIREEATDVKQSIQKTEAKGNYVLKFYN